MAGDQPLLVHHENRRGEAMKTKLSGAQERLLLRLSKSYDEDGLYVSRLERISATLLFRAGLVAYTNKDAIGVHCRLTDDGRVRAIETAAKKGKR